MGLTVLSIVPTDHLWKPTQEAAALTAEYLRSLDPEARDVRPTFEERVILYDAGENWEPFLTCPICGTPKGDETSAWIGDQLDNIGEHFRDLNITMDCCGRTASLNDVLARLTWPMAFASFSITIETPTRAWATADPWFSRQEMIQAGSLLGRAVRQVLAHS